jgi:hypothetical protein
MSLRLVWLLLLGCSSASAALIDNGSYTTDTDNQLAWLDMSFTDGDSYNDVLFEIDGGSLDGWRFATSGEVAGLLTSAVGGPFVFDDSPAQNDAMVSLIGLMGFTYEGNSIISGEPIPYQYAVGYVESDGLSLAHAIQFGFGWKGGYIRPFAETDWDLGFGTSRQSQGSFLVRSTVPVPAAVWLFGSALAGLGWMRRRKTT